MADSSTTKLSLTLPEVDVSTTWATSINNNFTTLDDSVLLTNTQTLENKTLTDCDATTQATGNNSTKIATTAFVKAELALQDALSELLDVDVSSANNNDVLAYNSSNQKFVNKTASNAGLQPTIADGDLTIAKTNGLQSALDAKQDTISSSSRINADLIHDGSISNTEFGHLNGVTSNIQTQINSISGVSEDTVVALSIALG